MSTPLLRVSGLSKRYESDGRVVQAVDSVDLSIARG